MDYIENILKYNNKKADEAIWLKYFYTIKKVLKYDIKYVNSHLLDIIKIMIEYFDDDIDNLAVITHAKSIIISNTDLIKYNDKTLFVHQKELFTNMKESVPKLIFYIAPTGTGKTLSPIGLSEQFRDCICLCC